MNLCSLGPKVEFDGLSGIEVGPGVTDRDYRGEIRALIINRSGAEFTAKPGDRICQLVIEKIYEGTTVLVPELGASQRGSSGFGGRCGSRRRQLHRSTW